jgi:hypothetical protein
MTPGAACLENVIEGVFHLSGIAAPSAGLPVRLPRDRAEAPLIARIDCAEHVRVTELLRASAGPP